jgi:plastocyanin
VSRRTVILAATIVVVIGLALAACGGDSGETVSPAPGVTQPAEGGEQGTDLQLAADPDGALVYTSTELQAPPGIVSIVLTNDSSVPHNVAIEKDDEVLAQGDIFSGGGTRTTTADLAAGTYTFFCEVPGHREAGMEGTLTIG